MTTELLPALRLPTIELHFRQRRRFAGGIAQQGKHAIEQLLPPAAVQRRHHERLAETQVDQGFGLGPQLVFVHLVGDEHDRPAELAQLRGDPQVQRRRAVLDVHDEQHEGRRGQGVANLGLDVFFELVVVNQADAAGVDHQWR